MAQITGGKFVAACLLAAALAAPTAALAAAATAPEAGGTLDLQAWPDSGQLIVITAVTVPEGVRLPVTVRVPVPEGAVVQWAGEILGGDLNADPARPYKIIKSPVGGQYAEFTLEQTRTAQVDADMPVVKVNGDVTSASFEWIQSASSPFTSFSVRVPGSASNVQISPQPSGQPETNAAGERLYSGDALKLEPGKKQAVAFSYSTGAVSPAASAGGVGTLVFALSAALVVAIAVLIAVVIRQRRSTLPAPSVRQDRSFAATTRADSSEKAPQPGPPSDDDWGFDDEG